MSNELELSNMPQMQNDWAEVYRMLKSIGFKLYEAGDDDLPACFEADFAEEIADANNLVMLESEILRNQLCIVLKPDSWFDVYVQEDIACGWVELPFRWSKISIDWLTDLKKAFTGEGFKKK